MIRDIICDALTGIDYYLNEPTFKDVYKDELLE